MDIVLESTNCEIGSVILLQLDTMGRIPIGFLWIFFKKYSLGVLVWFGGWQKSTQFRFINPFLNSRSSFFIMFCFRLLEMSSFSGLYTSGLLRCSIALLM